MVRLCFSFNGLPQKRTQGDPWVRCRFEDLVGRGKRNEVIYEADGDEKCQAAINLVANSEVGKMRVK